MRRSKDPKRAKDEDKTLYCSFCGRSQHGVAKLIAGPTVFICDKCVELSMSILNQRIPKMVDGDL